jgi:hypothetical protein
MNKIISPNGKIMGVLKLTSIDFSHRHNGQTGKICKEV